MTLAILDARDKEYVVVAAGTDLIATYVQQAIEAGQTAQDVLDAILAEGLAVGVFPSEAAGLSGTTSGQYFWVGSGGTVTLYLNDSGTGDEIAELATAAGLALKANTADLAAPTGGEMVGVAGGGTVQESLDALSEAIEDLPTSPEIIAMAQASGLAGAQPAIIAAEQAVIEAQEINQTVSDALAAGTVSDLVGTRIYTSRALLNADLAPADNLYALVVGDPTPANNDLYQKNGGTGAGAWDGPLGFFASASASAQASAVEASQAVADVRSGELELSRTLNSSKTTDNRFNLASARVLPSITRRGLSNIGRFSYPRVGVVGDSIMQANHSPFAARLLGKYARGMISVSHMLYPFFDFTAWTVDGAISSSEIDGLNKGKAGAQAGMGANATTGELGDFLNRLLLAYPEIIIISAGTNNIDIQTPAQAMAKITGMVDVARNSGAVVLVTNVRPLDATHGSYVPGQNAWIASLNALLLAWAETAPVGIVYADVFAVYDNGSGDADPALLSDHVHPNYLGSLKEAREVWLPIFRQIVSPSIPDKPTETNLLPNPDFSGTGASGTGFSGALAPGWGYQRDGGGATVVGSKDGTDRQVLTVTPGGAANDTDGILLALFGGQSITENAWFQYWFDVEIDDWPGWRIVQAGFGAGTLMEQAVSNVDRFNGQGKTRMLLQSPPMKRIAALGNPIDLQLRVYSVSDAAGSGALTINDAGMAIVADPRARYGMA